LAKHASRQFILARLVLGSAAAVLVALVVWIAVVAGGSGSSGTPLLVQPSAALQAAGASLPAAEPSTEAVSVPPSPTPSASASSSASPSPSASKSASPSASASAKPKPSKTPSRTPSASLSPTTTMAVSYSTSAAWRDGFIAAVKVVNNGSAAREWSVTLTYPSNADVEVRGGWNASVSASGGTVTLRGNSLAPGASITAGFQGSKDVSDAVKPISCAVGGGSCRMS
jgi:hypothetical protein